MKIMLTIWILLLLACNQIPDSTDEINHDTKIQSDSINIQTQKSIFTLTFKEYYSRGVLLYNRKQYAKSLTCFNQTIEIKPDYAPAYHKRAMAKYKLHNFDRLWNDIDTAIILNPNFGEAYFDRGCIKLMIEANFRPKSGCPDICRAYELGYAKQEKGISDNCDCGLK
jgi:tetratricopeptide (TPR) repeat protein